MYDDREYTHECVSCGMRSPPVQEGDTFLSTRHGWRLHRFTSPSGEVGFEWRCPGCWQRFKSTRAGEPASEPRPEPRPESGRYVMVGERTPRGPRSR